MSQTIYCNTMTNYPVIHSISTVGIVMHYNQDYLLHPVRTDFTGKNGIGKSLIADLLQILFIADKKNITFGTDSVKKEHRQIHTLPYDTDDAYVFINIEIKKGEYITIGANIPNKSSKPIKSFWILNKAYSFITDNNPKRDEISHLLIPKDKIPYNQDFIVNGEIPSIENLIVHLRSKELYLRSFADTSSKKEFYEFLFHKKVFPINLSIKSHLSAFAKVIQAFSKANTLNTESDSSLKSFLFEDKKAEIEGEYKNNKAKLKNLIKKYGDLKKFTTLLTSKRNSLEDLSKLKKLQENAQKEYSIAEYFDAKTQYASKQEEFKSANEILKKDEAQIVDLGKQIPKLKNNKTTASSTHKRASASVKALYNYSSHLQPYLISEKSLGELNELNLPDLSKEKKEVVDIKNHTLLDIKNSVAVLTPLIKKHKTLSDIENKYVLQQKALNDRKTTLHNQLKVQSDLKSILSLNTDNSLFSQIIKEKKPLTKRQETVLLKLLKNVSWFKPDNVEEGIQYTDLLSIYKDENIIEDKENKGYWLKTGALNTFVNYSKDSQVLKDPKNLKQLLQNKAKEVNKSIDLIENELNAIKNFEDDTTFNKELIKVDIVLDQDILNNTKVNSYKDAIKIIKNISSKKDEYEQSYKDQLSVLNGLKEQIDLEFENATITKSISKAEEKEEKLHKQLNEATRKLTVAETTLELLENTIEEKRKLPKKLQVEVGNLKSTSDSLGAILNKKHPDISLTINEEEGQESELKEAEKTLNALEIRYKSKYESIVEIFSEIKDDIEIKEQIELNSFSYEILEFKLLGKNIKEIKNITEALEKANSERYKMRKTIHETMLKIFQKTRDEFAKYRSVVFDLNTFFKGRIISQKYYFQIEFNPKKEFKIDWINDLQMRAQIVGEEGELFEADSIESYVENFFKEVTSVKNDIRFSDLLDPKSYFNLKTKFTDKNNNEKPGSTGESYTALVLLGIGRLSIVVKKNRPGLRFLILEEVSNLDSSNFSTFPSIAEDFNYQIITMTPRPFGSDSEGGWYLHQLIEGVDDKNINYPTPNSSYKTNEDNEQLFFYLKRTQN